MDGNTAIISRAAKIAVEKKGMIIVNSIGNEGNKDWKYVVAPADVEGVISVGATKKNDLKELKAGEVGYIIAGIKEIHGAPVGDTITISKKECSHA